MNKLNAARVLMIASIVVIAAFQVYWLHKLYREEYDRLKRTSDLVFKESIYRLQESRFKGDSLLESLPTGDIFSKDLVRVLRVRKDSANTRNNKAVFISVADSKKHLQIDSTKPPVAGKFILRTTSERTKMTNTVRFAYNFNDSIAIKSIDSAYTIALGKANIRLEFIIVKTSPEATDSCPGDFCTDKVPIGIFAQNFYLAAFPAPTAYLVKEITGQMLLSLFVLLLTCISFLFIYRSLLEHKRMADIKNEFISNITHELKTPIATVTVAIEAMKSFNALQSPERTREYLDIADNELQRLSLLVDKVLKLSMFEQEQLELKFETIDIKQLANEIMLSMRIQFEKHRAQVRLVANEEVYNMQGDRLHLMSMLYNLLDNAIKYTPDNPVIELKIADTGNVIHLEIKDNGVGITSEYRDKIFEKFFRVPGNNNRHNVKGYGLGLSYVAHIVEKHHGTIKVESLPGVGTTFKIDLPKTNEKS